MRGDSLRFQGKTYAVTDYDLVVRDGPEMLVVAHRSRNVSREWEVQRCSVHGLGVHFKLASRERAVVAAALVEQFDDGDDALAPTQEYAQRSPDYYGVPTAVALDGLESIVAYRFVAGDDRETIATQIQADVATVDDMLTTVCDRTVGFPDPTDAPTVGEIVESIPNRFRPPIPRATESSLQAYVDTNTDSVGQEGNHGRG
jgi:hypothetical protein